MSNPTNARTCSRAECRGKAFTPDDCRSGKCGVWLSDSSPEEDTEYGEALKAKFGPDCLDSPPNGGKTQQITLAINDQKLDADPALQVHGRLFRSGPKTNIPVYVNFPSTPYPITKADT